MKLFEGKSHYPIDFDTLPSGWASAFVGEVCDEIQSGFASGEHNSASRGVPHLRPMNVDRAGKVDLTVIKSVDGRVDSRRLSSGDVLFNNTNSAALVGKTAPVSLEGELSFSNHMTRLRPSNGIDYRFLALHLHYLWMSGYFLHRCSRHVNQASVSSKTLANSVPLAIPPTREQSAIVESVDSHLSRLDDAAASLERAQARLKSYRASVLRAAVEGRLVPTEAALAHAEKRDFEPADVLLDRILKERRRRWEEAELARLTKAGKTPKDEKWRHNYQVPAGPDGSALPRLPEGWCWATTGQLCLKIGDVDHKMPEAAAAGIPYVSTRDFRSNDDIDFSGAKRISPEAFVKLASKIQPTKGDILLSRYGTVGEVRLVRTTEAFQASYSISILKLVDHALSYYVAHALRSAPLQSEMRRWTRASAQPDLGLEHIRQLSVPLPPAAEQLRICEALDRQLSRANQMSEGLAIQLSRVGRLRQCILRVAFAGKLVDQDPADEPASQRLARIREQRSTSSVATKAKSSRKRGKA